MLLRPKKKKLERGLLASLDVPCIPKCLFNLFNRRKFEKQCMEGKTYLMKLFLMNKERTIVNYSPFSRQLQIKELPPVIPSLTGIFLRIYGGNNAALRRLRE